MFNDAQPIATVAVTDLDRAGKFYGEILGLERDPAENPGGVLYRLGAGHVFVYPSQFAGTNKATGITIITEDFDADVAALREAGITFDTFDMPEGSWEDGILSDPSMGKVAWFHDPDGNVISLATDPRDR